MNIKKYILFLLFSIFFSEDVEIVILSSAFTIDTVNPEITILTPNHGDVFGANEQIIVTWNATDDSPTSQPMTLNVSAFLDNPYFELASNFANTGQIQLNVPENLNTLFASIRLDIRDYYGNISFAYSNGYFTLGNPNLNNYNMNEENITIETQSNSFTIDTKAPIVNWIFPNESTSFDPMQGQVVRWDAYDDDLNNNSIELSFIDGGQDYYLLADSLSNNGLNFITLPNIITTLGQFKVSATDNYGNTNYDLSDNYMFIGTDNIEIEDESVAIEAISSPFIVDTKIPTFELINETDYFFPNGGEVIENYNALQLDWNCYDESFENGMVEVSLGYLLGGWYTVIDTFHHSSIYAPNTDLSLNGIVDNTIWARLIFTSIDDYGNRNSRYNDDYFVLGNGNGDIGAELFNEDDLEMFISWTWENKKHRIAIKPSALQNFNAGDMIDIIDENGIIDNDCGSDNGPVSLGSGIIEEVGVNNILRMNPIQTKIGVNHCSVGAGGGKMPGYVEGDTIRVRITSNDTSYYLRPSDHRGSLVFNNRNTIIKEFNMSPYQINQNTDIVPFLTIDDRDIDNFNVYSKVTNHSTSLNRESSCDNDGVCDSAELISDYQNQTDCANAGFEWDISYSICYFDHNLSGDYSPDEIDENIASCYNDCCSIQGNDDWCFVEMVSDEEFNHSLVSNNYLPANTSTATVSYKVYALDDELNEVYEAVSEDANISLGSSDISSIELGAGWNWFSLNRNIENMNVNSVFSQFLNEEWQCDYGGSDTNCPYYIKSQDAYGIFYEGYGFYPEFTMELESFYKLQMNAPSELWYGGALVDPSTNQINLNTGWNWIGYLSQGPLSINTALADLINNNSPSYAKSQSGFAIYYEDFGFYPEFTMDINGGYMLQMSQEDILTFPTVSSSYNNNTTFSSNNQRWDFNYRNFEHSASATLKINIDQINQSENDYVAIFDNDICVGISKSELCPINNELLFSVLYYNNQSESENLKIKYYNADSDITYDINETLEFVQDENYGNVFEPILLHDKSIPLEYKLEAPYPNPFNPITNIGYQIPKDISNLNLNIYDVRGRIVKNIYNGPINSGYHSYTWNANNVSSGIYFVVLKTEDFNASQKITLIK